MGDENGKKDVKIEPKIITKPIKKLSTFEIGRIASFKRAHEVKVQTFLVSR